MEIIKKIENGPTGMMDRPKADVKIAACGELKES